MQPDASCRFTFFPVRRLDLSVPSELHRRASKADLAAYPSHSPAGYDIYRRPGCQRGSVGPSEVVMKPAPWLGAFILCGALLSGCGDDDSGSTAAGVCESYCATLDECGYGLMSGPCQISCESEAQAAAAISGACAAAAAAEGRCIGALSCDRLDDWADDVPNAPCQAEDAASTAACNR
jgi:hypothetical protein